MRSRGLMPPQGTQRSVTVLVVVRPFWTIFSVIFGALELLQALLRGLVQAQLDRHRAGALGGRGAGADRDRLALLAHRLRGNGRGDRDLARPGDRDLDAEPGRRELHLRREFATGAGAAGHDRRPEVGGAGGGGGETGGRKAAMFAPPIAPRLPVGEITTGAEPITPGRRPSWACPRPSGRRRRSTRRSRASWDTDASLATPVAGTKQSTAAGKSGTRRCPRSRSGRSCRSSASAVQSSPRTPQLAVRGDVRPVQVEPDAGRPATRAKSSRMASPGAARRRPTEWAITRLPNTLGFFLPGEVDRARELLVTGRT